MTAPWKGSKRQLVWLHNSFKGYAAMMKQNARAIISASTTTYDAKRLAAQIESLAHDLRIELDKRIDP